MMALTRGDGAGSRIEVMCTACFKSLGTFNRETLLVALLSKGDILCPPCRKLHCQFCGWVETYRGMPDLEKIEIDGLPYRICELCVRVQDGRQPLNAQCVANIRPHARRLAPHSETLV